MDLLKFLDISLKCMSFLYVRKGNVFKVGEFSFRYIYVEIENWFCLYVEDIMECGKVFFIYVLLCIL